MPTPPTDVVSGAVATSAWANAVADALQAMIGDMYAGAALAIPWASVTGKPSTFTPTDHTHAGAGTGGTVAYGDVAGKPSAFTPTAHTHHDAGTGGTVAYADVASKPSTFVPTDHTHAGAGTGGTVTWANVGSKPTTFAPIAHASAHATGGGDALAAADIGAWDGGPGTIYVGTSAPSSPVEGDIWVKG